MDTATQLQNVGIQPTGQRIIIYKMFSHASAPLSVTSILALLHEQNEPVHRATVFRTVHLFELKRLLRKVDFFEGELRYELASLPHHHHAVCRTCGKIETIYDCVIHDIQKAVRRRLGFEIVEHSFEIFGICKQCKKLI